MKSILALAFLGLVTLAPLAAACAGISPGDELNVGDLRCTLAFLLADKTGLYFATAGHCIKEGELASVPGVGPLGTGALHYLDPETGAETDGSPGNDFGLILIDEANYDKLNPKMCGFEGPTGIYDATPGSGGVNHWGHGAVFGDLGPTTQKRQGLNLENNNTAFYWTGAGVPGDSGSGVLADDGRALGVLTHLQAGVTTDTNGGTHLYRGFQLAKELKGLDLRLVLAGEDPIAILQELRSAPATNDTAPSTTTQPTKAGTSSPPGNSTSTTTRPTTSAGPGDELTPAAELEPTKETPAAGAVLVMAALALVALRKRR